MTDKELSKLRRTELLEMLIAQGKENAALQEQLKQAQEAQQGRELLIAEAGTMADAAFQLNDVIGSAQKAVDLYVENVKRLMAQQQQEAEAAMTDAKAHASQVVTDADERAQWLLTAARDQAAHILSDAHSDAERILAQAREDAAQLRAEAQKEREELLAQAGKAAEKPAEESKPEPGAKNVHKPSPLMGFGKRKRK